MQTITTKYAGPTDTKGSCIVAKCWIGRVVHNWNCEIGVGTNHDAAAQKMVNKLNSDRKKAGHDDYLWSIVASGNLPDCSGNAYVVSLVPNNEKKEV